MSKQKITIQDIADRAGVSNQTVSRVLNGKPDVAESTRQRIEQIIDELRYVPSTAARTLRNQGTKTIGLIVPDNANPFFAEIARGVENAGFQAGYSVVLCNSNKSLERELEHLRMLQAKQVDGIIFIASTTHIDQIRPLVESGIPVVMFYRDPGDLNVDTFKIDNQRAGYIATQYLVDLGHTAIACIRPASATTPSGKRVLGYQQVMTEQGLPWSDALTPQGDNLLSGGEEAARQLLDGGVDFTAIFATNDAMAIGAMRALRSRGYRIPEDVSVIGVDDIILASYVDPPLTTVAQPKQIAGEQAVNYLIQRMENNLPEGARTTILDVELIIRDSCAPPLL
jgi:LacI family transcriptional regulator